MKDRGTEVCEAVSGSSIVLLGKSRKFTCRDDLSITNSTVKDRSGIYQQI